MEDPFDYFNKLIINDIHKTVSIIDEKEKVKRYLTESEFREIVYYKPDIIFCNDYVSDYGEMEHLVSIKPYKQNKYFYKFKADTKEGFSVLLLADIVMSLISNIDSSERYNRIYMDSSFLTEIPYKQIYSVEISKRRHKRV